MAADCEGCVSQWQLTQVACDTVTAEWCCFKLNVLFASICQKCIPFKLCQWARQHRNAAACLDTRLHCDDSMKTREAKPVVCRV